MKKALKTFWALTTEDNILMGAQLQALLEIRSMRQDLRYQVYIPLVYLANVFCILYFVTSKLYKAYKDHQNKVRLQQAIQLRQERELLLQQLRN